jgi:hypothetical protein
MFRTLAVLTVSLSALVCRFTVRDVGFVDLGDPTYKLYAFVSKNESPDAHAGIQRLSAALFAETNVEVELFDPDSEEEHDAYRLLGELKIQEFPTTVLVHPDGHAIEVPINGKFDEVGGSTLESVFLSPVRRRILDGVLRRYCVVLLAEGSDPKENARVKQSVNLAFKDIERVFDKMPKAVGDLPELLVIPQDGRKDEKILLWSLGLATQSPPDGETLEPSIAVMFGRGRRFGPILDGAAITQASVVGILANAGQSCECELDRSWMRGPRIPMRWDADTKQKAVELLKFDPENPLVKSEISGILARGSKSRGGRSQEPTVADLLGSYSEETIDSEPDEDPPTAVATTERQQENEDDANHTWHAMLWTLAGLLGLGVIAAFFVLSRARR